jgi:hypothetical protein
MTSSSITAPALDCGGEEICILPVPAGLHIKGDDFFVRSDGDGDDGEQRRNDGGVEVVAARRTESLI